MPEVKDEAAAVLKRHLLHARDRQHPARKKTQKSRATFTPGWEFILPSCRRRHWLLLARSGETTGGLVLVVSLSLQASGAI
jgi:hypothetical protein